MKNSSLNLLTVVDGGSDTTTVVCFFILAALAVYLVMSTILIVDSIQPPLKAELPTRIWWSWDGSPYMGTRAELHEYREWADKHCAETQLERYEAYKACAVAKYNELVKRA